MTLKEKAIKGVIWSAVESWGRQAVSFIVFSVLARLLNPEAFGLIALAGAFLGFIQLFLDQGLSRAIVQHQDLEPEHLDTAFWTNLGISSLLTMVSLALAPWIAQAFGQTQLIPILRWLSLVFLFSAFSSVQQAILERNLAFKALAKRSLIAIVISGMIGVGMALMDFGIWSLVGQQLSNSLVQVVALWWVSDWRPRFRFSSKHFQDLFSFGINEVGFNIFNFFSRRGDDLIIGYFLGPVALGYYTVAYRVLRVMTELLISVTNKVALPTFSRLQHDPERMRSAFYMATQMSSFVAFPCFLGVAVLAPELIETLFGAQWLPSVRVMQVLALVGLLQSVSYFNGSVILAMGKPFWRLCFTVASGLANITAYLIAVQWGILAVASAFVIRAYIFSPIPVWMIHKLIHIDFKTYLRQFVCPFISSSIMVIMIIGIKQVLRSVETTSMLLAIYIIVGSLVYISVIALLSPQLIQKILDFAQMLRPQKGS